MQMDGLQTLYCISIFFVALCSFSHSGDIRLTNELTAAFSFLRKHKEGMRMARSFFAMAVGRTTALIDLIDSPYGQFIFSDKEAYERAVFGLKAFQLFE